MFTPHCPNCSARLRLRDILASNKFTCAACGTALEWVPWRIALTIAIGIGANQLVDAIGGRLRVVYGVACYIVAVAVAFALFARPRIDRSQLSILNPPGPRIK